MPVSPGIALAIGIIAGVLYLGDKVVHLKSVHKANHVICRVATLGQKCKPKK